jgi:hypothetical protein
MLNVNCWFFSLISQKLCSETNVYVTVISFFIINKVDRKKLLKRFKQNKLYLMNLPDFSGLDDEGAPAPKPLRDQVVMNGSGREKRSDRNSSDSDSSIRQDEEVVLLRSLLGLEADVVDDGLQVGGVGDRVGDVDHLRGPAAVVGQFDNLKQSIPLKF